jgi:hypothetical protein
MDRRCGRAAIDDTRAVRSQVIRGNFASSLLRQTGSNSRSKIERRIARVLSAIGAAVSHFYPNSPKLLDSFRHRSVQDDRIDLGLRIERCGLGLFFRSVRLAASGSDVGSTWFHVATQG